MEAAPGGGYGNNSSLGEWAGEWAGGDAGLCPPSVGGVTFLVVAYIVMMGVGLVGNACLVLVIAHQGEMRNVTNVLIANLSCSDILMCVVCLPVTVVYTLMDRWVLGETLCKAMSYVQCTSVTVSSFSLVLIALERHQLILHPTGWTPAAGHSYLAVVTTWVVACILSLPFLFFTVLDDPFPNITFPTQHLVCIEQWPSVQHRLVYTTSLLLLQYCLPVSLILLCYLRIFLRLRRRKGLPMRARQSRGGGEKARDARQINAMLVAIVAAFALCWLPLTIFNTIFDWHHESLPACQHDAIFSACHLTAMASTCVNPVIYGFLNSNFQKELKATLQRCRCWGAPESYESFPLSTVGTEVSSLCRSSAATRADPGAANAESNARLHQATSMYPVNTQRDCSH